MFMDILILFSGGIDSTACLNYFLKRKDNVNLLYFIYGQPNEQLERKAAIAVASYYNLKLNIINIEGCSVSEGMIPGRNAFLLSLSLLKVPFKNGGVAIGIHDHSIYSDCSESFLNLMQNIFNIYHDGCIKILAPFIHWDKGDIINYAKSEKIPLELVYSTSLDKDFYYEKDIYETEKNIGKV
jgi:7-cyano-7-deazaguanine synthase